MKVTYGIGMMSGTSLDGLDLAYVKFFENSENIQFEILASETQPYPKEWFDKLQNAYLQPENLVELDWQYGKYLGQQLYDFIEKNNVKNLDFVASHGHTILHQPEKGITVQIGNGELLAQKMQVPVVYDFRIQDVELGGQGAPLVPIGDELLFSKFDACINLGGFSNISLIENDTRIAFDICPVNIVLNHFARKLGKPFDENGKLAQEGKFNSEVFGTLNSLNYYHLQPPKSLGIEWVDTHIMPFLDSLEPKEALQTFTQHISFQINKVIKEYGLQKVLLTGGGAYNSYLVSLLENAEIIIPSKEIIEYKEALIFALLGYLRLESRVNVLSSVTGATKDHSSGKVIYPSPLIA